MIQQIVKRDGRVVPFELDKITEAIYKAAQALGGQDRIYPLPLHPHPGAGDEHQADEDLRGSDLPRGP